MGAAFWLFILSIYAQLLKITDVVNSVAKQQKQKSKCLKANALPQLPLNELCKHI